MDKPRDGDWMQTIGGRPYWPLDPRPEDVDIEDICWALSHMCRFTGHVKRFYSVAEHSVLVSLIVPREQALQALLHDATEAYLMDVARPVKKGLSNYASIELRNWIAIAERFSVPVKMHPLVKIADDAVLMAGKRALLRPSATPWSILAQPADVRIWAHGPRVARWRFMRRFKELTAC